MEQAIYFYAETEPYFEFSNFYLRSLSIDGVDWPSTEHYYQAQKFLAAPDKERIRNCASAAEAFMLGQSLITARVDDWDAIKVCATCRFAAVVIGDRRGCNYRKIFG